MAFEIGGYDLLNFVEMVDVIETYAHLILMVAAIYYLWLIVVGGQGETGSMFGSAGRGLGSVGGWLKDKGAVPFTREHREKFKRFGGKYTKRGFDVALSQKIVDHKLKQRMVTVKNDVTTLDAAKTALEGEAPVNPVTDENKVKAFEVMVKKSLSDLSKEWNTWRRVDSTFRRTYPTYMKMIKKMKKSLAKDSQADATMVSELQILEEKVLKQHVETKTHIANLKAMLEDLEQKTESALSAVDGAGNFDLVAAQGVLATSTFIGAPAIAQECEDIQEQIETDLNDIISRVHSA